MSLQELESAVSQLPAGERTAFARWFEQYLADAKNVRIEPGLPAPLGNELRGSVLRYDDPTAPVAEATNGLGVWRSLAGRSPSWSSCADCNGRSPWTNGCSRLFRLAP